MDTVRLTPEQILAELIERYPQLESCRDSIFKAYIALVDCYESEGKVLVAGNGGSASDSEHITGELMKSFRFRHDIDKDQRSELAERFGEDGKFLADTLESRLAVQVLHDLHRPAE